MAASSGEPVELRADNIMVFLSRYDTIMTDCDGVLWSVGTYDTIPGIGNAVSKLRSLGKRFIFVTNNTMGKKSVFLDKFPNVAGFDIEETDLYMPARAAAVHLRDVVNLRGKCYLVGGQGVAEELEKHGIEVVGLGPDPDLVTADPALLLEQKLDPEVKAVVVGYDEHLCYNKIFKAASYISHPDCTYLALNDREFSIQLTPKYRQPVTGTMVAAVTAAAEKQPIVVGKPYRPLLDCILAKNPGLDLSHAVMFGDSIWADIPFAKKNGITSVLVLSGECSLKEVEKYRQSKDPNDHIHVPDYYINSLADIIKFM